MHVTKFKSLVCEQINLISTLHFDQYDTWFSKGIKFTDIYTLERLNVKTTKWVVVTWRDVYQTFLWKIKNCLDMFLIFMRWWSHSCS